MDKKIKLAFMTAAIVLLVLGLGFLTASFFVYRSYYFAKDNYIETEATIVTHYDNGHDESNSSYTIISYLPVGEANEVTVKANYYNSFDKIGEKITIKYNTEDYNKVKVKSMTNTLVIVFAAVGGFQLIPVLIILGIAISIIAKQKYYLTKGKRSVAKVVSLKANYSLSFGNTHPQKIECKLKNGTTIKATLYSGKFYDTNNTLVVDVYKHENKEKYFIDGKSIRVADSLSDEMQAEDITDMNNFNF